MNTKATHEPIAAQSTGERLRIAREQIGLSQQAVAEHLRLKVSTIRDIEDDNMPSDLASTFLRGYIRSYARLVHIPEEELLPMIEKQAAVKSIAPMQGFNLKKQRKKRDGWLMGFTWLILLIALALTGAWWWQNHQAQQAEISSMASQTNTGQAANNPPEPAHAGDNNIVTNNDAPQGAASQTQQPVSTPVTTSANNAPNTAPQQNVTPGTPVANNAVVSPSQTPTSNAETSAQTTPAQTAATTPTADPNALAMNFNADCWLEVTDATGKVLFSGLQRKDATLNLAGQTPYKLKIGAPAAVQIQFQGKPVDLSRFIKSSQIARLTLNAQ